MAVFQHHQAGRPLVVETRTCERWPIQITGRYVELELTVEEAEWLQAVALPAALDRHRRAQRAAA